MSHSFSVRPRKSDLDKRRSDLLLALESGDQLTATRIVDESITKRWDPSFVYVNLVGHCLARIGEKWHNGELGIAEEHRATQIALRLLGHAQSSFLNGKKNGRKAVITSVQGDNHVIGGLTFADLLRFDGWDVQFLGADSPIESVADLVATESPDLVGLSVTIEDFLPNALATVEAIKKLDKPPVVVVGGAAATDESLGSAEFSSTDAVSAVEWTRRHFGLDETSVTLEVMLAELGSRIQALRKDVGFSQQGLANEAGLDRSYISAVEHGKQNVSFATLKSIGDALGVSVGELLDN